MAGRRAIPGIVLFLCRYLPIGFSSFFLIFGRDFWEGFFGEFLLTKIIDKYCQILVNLAFGEKFHKVCGVKSLSTGIRNFTIIIDTHLIKLCHKILVIPFQSIGSTCTILERNIIIEYRTVNEIYGSKQNVAKPLIKKSTLVNNIKRD